MNLSIKSAAGLGLLVSALPVVAADNDEIIKQLQQQVEALQKEVQQLKDQSSDTSLLMPGEERPLGEEVQKARGLKLGFYGEAKYRVPEAGSSSLDPHRFVLTPSYQINDWLHFNSELELEHGAVDEESDGRNRFDGELELEQFYVDMTINEHFNIRSLGIDLVPVGRINLHHEPTLFYSTERPELYREIIPSTWFEPSAGVFGKITDGLRYQLMVSTGLEDFVPGANETGVSGRGGVRGARPRLRRTSEDNLAVSGRLAYNALPGLDASTSFYTASVPGQTGDTQMTLLDLEASYRVPRTGLEFRGEVAWWLIDDPSVLVANNNTSLTDDVGDNMYGWYVEAAYHWWPDAWREGKGSEMELVPFVRYSDIVLQSGLPAAAMTLDNGTANRDFLTFGAAYFLNRNFVLKADYRHNLKRTDSSATSGTSQDYFQLGAGVFF